MAKKNLVKIIRCDMHCHYQKQDTGELVKVIDHYIPQILFLPWDSYVEEEVQNNAPKGANAYIFGDPPILMFQKDKKKICVVQYLMIK